MSCVGVSRTVVGMVAGSLLAWVAVTSGAATRSATTPAGADDTRPGNIEYTSRFTFVRLSYDMGLRGGGFFYGGRDLPWAHDYPRAEQNLTRILADLSLLDPAQGPYGGNVFPVGDAETHRYPLAYMSEPGYWTQTDEEAQRLGDYMLKGGFLIFDDFRGDHWENFERQLRRALPEAKLVKLDVSHPVFHAFFDIKTLEMAEMYIGYTPQFYGVFEDNDPTRRLMVVANYNNDIGEYWEFDGMDWLPIDLTNDAYKFGVNYVMYAMTH